MADPQFGWPLPFQTAWLILDPNPSEGFPDGRIVKNVGGILGTYVRVAAGHYTFVVTQTGATNENNLGVLALSWSDGGAEESSYVNYSIELSSPPKLHIYVFTAGVLVDPPRVTVTIMGQAAGAPA